MIKCFQLFVLKCYFIFVDIFLGDLTFKSHTLGEMICILIICNWK